MIRGFALLLIIILFIRAWYYYRKIAQKRCSEFSTQVTKERHLFEQTLAEVLKAKAIVNQFDFIKPGEKVFLIEKGQLISVYSLNTDKQQTMLKSQYRKLEHKLNIQNPAYSYSFESYSIYYQLPFPNENYILRISS